MKINYLGIGLLTVWLVSGLHLSESVNRNLTSADCLPMTATQSWLVTAAAPVLQAGDLFLPVIGYELSASCSSGRVSLDRIEEVHEDDEPEEDLPKNNRTEREL